MSMHFDQKLWRNCRDCKLCMLSFLLHQQQYQEYIAHKWFGQHFEWQSQEDTNCMKPYQKYLCKNPWDRKDRKWILE
jgi:hypothetical protein